MIYEYQYDMAAIIALLLLFSTYMIRRSCITKSTIYFIILIVTDFIAAVLDAISCFTISYPEKYSLVFNYVVCLGYLFFFHGLSALFLLYIDSKANLDYMKKIVLRIVIIVLVLNAFAIFSSPWTHMVAYYDENLNYTHGWFVTGLYSIPFFIFGLEIYLFYKSKRNFNKYQVITSIFIIVVMGAAVLIQIFFERMVICQFMIALDLFFIYMAFENPAYYTYRETQCMNKKAFYTILNSSKYRDSFHIVILSLKDYEYIRNHHGTQIIEELSSKVSEHLFHTFKYDAFCLSEDKYVIVVNREEELEKTKSIIKSYFDNPIELKEMTLKVLISINVLYQLNEKFRAEDIEDMVDYQIDNPEEKMNSNALMEMALQKKHHREQILHIIKRALEQDEFQVYYQPIYKLKSKKFESAEALIRLFDQELGFINPEEMIRIAEENGYIDQIGETVFRKVCECISRNQISQYGLKYIEINLSPIQCMQIDLVEQYTKIMREYDVEPGQINLEITETAEFEDESQIYVNIEQLHSEGIELSIDDYGSGFASADYLIKLPVSIVKIDKGILWEAMKKPSAMIVLENTIKMIQDLGKQIVVEGVENHEMVRVLTDCHCDYLQGYFYSKPVREEEFIMTLKQNAEM